MSFLDARELADVIGKNVRLRRSGRSSWVGLCPFHHEKTPSFYVFKAKGGDGRGRYRCFGCGARGDSIDWLRRVEGKSFFAAGGEQAVLSDRVRRERSEMRLRRKQDALRRYRDRHPDCGLPDWAIEFH